MTLHIKSMVLNAGLIALPLLAFGWGAGHDTVARAIAARLPQPWCDRVQGETLKRFCADNHYPDSFEPFPVERVGAEALMYLKARDITKRYDLHSDKGRAMAFCLLTRALKEEQPGRALLWLACLAHATADMAACNHDPVVHIATYGWCTAEWGLKLPRGKAFSEVTPCLDLGWIEKETWAKAVFERRLGECELKDGGGTPEATLLEIMLYGVRGVEACAPHGPNVLSAAAEWVDSGERPAGERLAEELSALGVWAVERTLRDFQTAVRLAPLGVAPEVTPDVVARYEEARDAFVRERPLAADLFAQSALVPSGVKGHKIGVVIEPCWRMDEGMFGFGDRVLAVQIVNALRRQGKNAELVDVRTFLEKGAEVQALIVPAQRCASYRKLKVEALDKRLGAYLDAGGKVVWVGGGKPPGALRRGLPKDFMAKGDDKAWPVPMERFRLGSLGVAGDIGWKLRRPLEGQAGWQWPRNPFAFTQEAVSQGAPLVELSCDGQSETVGLAWPKEKPSVAYVPGYAVMPYVWTSETPALSPLRLELDAAGTRAIEAALKF
jgi:hypothetical protein